MTRRPVHRKPALDAPLFDETAAEFDFTPDPDPDGVWCEALADAMLPSLELLEPLP